MSALIHAFPTHRHIQIVRTLVEEMTARTPAAAKEFLIWHLGVEWDRLEKIGVADDEIEARVDELGQTMWRLVFSGAQGDVA